MTTPPDPSGTPGYKAYLKLKEFISEAEEPLYRTNEQSIIAKIMRIFFDDHAQSAIADALTAYVFNITIETAKEAVERAEEYNLDRIDEIKTAISRIGIHEASKNLVSTLSDAVSASRRERKSTKQLTKLTANHSECYICNSSIGSSQYNIDHVFPVRAGGSDSHKNIRRAHVQCEAPKLGIAFPSDAPILSFSFRRLPTELEKANLSPIINSSITAHDSHDHRVMLNKIIARLHYATLRFAILQHQRYLCNCGSPLGEKIHAIKRDDNHPWTFTNTQFICASCQSQLQKNELEDP